MAGDLSGSISGYMMSQVAASAKQILQSYHDAIIDCLSDIDNFWLHLVADNSYNPMMLKKLPKIDPDFEMTAKYSIKIPGDVVQRATVARMICPDFKLSIVKTMDLLFPEISNPMKEQAMARNDTAMANPMAVTINMIAGYRQNALYLRSAGDTVQADLFDKAATMLEEQLIPQQPSSNQQVQPSAMPTQPYNKQPSTAAMPQQAVEGVPPELQGMV
jgi:hypothetical protein